MKISIFGLGYVGSVSAARFAEIGYEVIGVDVNEEKVAMINAGRSPIVEPGLDELLKQVTSSGRLRATTSTAEAVAASDLALVCVGTPGHPNGSLNLDALRGVFADIGRALQHRHEPYTVVVRSTVLPGTTERYLIPALRSAAGDTAEVHVAVNPEFMCEGTALQDFLQPPFTLVGCDDPDTASRVATLYAGVHAPLVHANIRTAEMVKYACNAFHALKVCFANEMGDICDALGADAQEVMRIFRMDHKLNISGAYLKPGFAFGGSCLPKDVRALAHAARSSDVQPRVLDAIMPSNAAQVERAVEAVLSAHTRRIGVLGLAFKHGTDDLRESPMVTLVEALIGKGCDVRILDHNVSIARLTGANRRYIEEEIPHIASLMCAEAAELLAHAELLVIGNAGEATEHLLRMVAPEIPVVDLTRGAVRLSPTQTRKADPTWSTSLSSSSTPSQSRPAPLPAHS